MSQDELLAWFMARDGCVRVYEVEDQLQLFATDPTPMTKLIEFDTYPLESVIVRQSVFLLFRALLPNRDRLLEVDPFPSGPSQEEAALVASV